VYGADRIDSALLSSDAAALGGLLAEQFFPNDFLGGVTREPQLLESLGTGELRFHSIVPHDLSARLYREAAIVTGWTEMKAEFRERSAKSGRGSFTSTSGPRMPGISCPLRDGHGLRWPAERGD
jgi:Domain of unknown function (DUF4440)